MIRSTAAPHDPSRPTVMALASARSRSDRQPSRARNLAQGAQRHPRRHMAVATLGLVAVLATSTAHASDSAASPDLFTQQQRGAHLLRQRGCLSCHSLDGSQRAAPSFGGLYGRPRQVLTDGQQHTVIADEPYIQRAIVQPKADVVVGYCAGQMPTLRLADDELAAMVSTLRALAALSTDAAADVAGQQRARALASLATQNEGGVTILLASLLAFVGLHFALSARRTRAALIAGLGEKGFLGLYSLIAFAALGGIVYGFRSAPYVVWWTPPLWARHSALALMPLALFFLVAGFSTPNPAAAGQDHTLSQAEPAAGILRISRHPALCGFALWAVLHMLANGDRSGILTFFSIFVLSVGGMFHIDSRRAHSQGEAWSRFREKTSRLPFAAILSGRQSLRLSELGLVRPLAALLLYGAILASHRFVYGVSPLP